jgi:hypothetical protein
MQPAVKNNADEKLNPDESLLGQVDSGKEPVTRHGDVGEFLKDIEQMMSENPRLYSKLVQL